MKLLKAFDYLVCFILVFQLARLKIAMRR